MWNKTGNYMNKKWKKWKSFINADQIIKKWIVNYKWSAIINKNTMIYHRNVWLFNIEKLFLVSYLIKKVKNAWHILMNL